MPHNVSALNLHGLQILLFLLSFLLGGIFVPLQVGGGGGGGGRVVAQLEQLGVWSAPCAQLERVGGGGGGGVATPTQLEQVGGGMGEGALQSLENKEQRK